MLVFTCPGNHSVIVRTKYHHYENKINSFKLIFFPGLEVTAYFYLGVGVLDKIFTLGFGPHRKRVCMCGETVAEGSEGRSELLVQNLA